MANVFCIKTKITLIYLTVNTEREFDVSKESKWKQDKRNKTRTR